MYCKKCGEGLDEGSEFCANCGSPVKAPKKKTLSKRPGKALFSPWCPECNKYKGKTPQCPHCNYNENTGKIEPPKPPVEESPPKQETAPQPPPEPVKTPSTEPVAEKVSHRPSRGFNKRWMMIPMFFVMVLFVLSSIGFFVFRSGMNPGSRMGSMAFNPTATEPPSYTYNSPATTAPPKITSAPLTPAPYTVTESREVILDGRTFTTSGGFSEMLPVDYEVPPNEYFTLQRYIDTTDKESNEVIGRIHVEYRTTQGDYSCTDCMAFFVLDQENFILFDKGNLFTSYVTIRKNNEYYLDFAFVPDKTDDYYFVFLNLMADKELVPEIWTKHTFKVTVTKQSKYQ
ncbi:MAG: zinc-ribbon domain-containing protein [Desulfatiglandales bacterium]